MSFLTIRGDHELTNTWWLRKPKKYWTWKQCFVLLCARRSEEAGVSFALSPPCPFQSGWTLMTFGASRGSHRKAVHQHATLPLHPLKEKYHIKKLFSVVSWIGFLASTVSEFGFDMDFPLTPSLWLVIAACAVIGATAHAAIGSRIHANGKRKTGTYLSGDVSSLCDSASSISDRSPSIYQNSFSVNGGHGGQMSSNRRIITASDVIPAVIFLSPAVTRGPPWHDSQIARTPSHSARLFCTAPLPSVIHFPKTNRPTIKSRTGEPA